MSIEKHLIERSNNSCELCFNADELHIYAVPPDNQQTADGSVYLCNTCLEQVEKREQLDSAHWRTLSDSMWSSFPSVQVVAWRMLNRLRQEAWAADNLDMLYLDDDTLAWAKKTGDHEQDGTVTFHQDINGTRLHDGDTVVLTKTLDVKGSSLSAKLGTVVKNIRLVADQAGQIEGKIEGQTIVILTKYLRKG